jgi:hypothetical protein
MYSLDAARKKMPNASIEYWREWREWRSGGSRGLEGWRAGGPPREQISK